MVDVTFTHIDETYIRLTTHPEARRMFKQEFSFYPPNYRFHPKYKAGLWDGRISMIGKGGEVLKGLLPDLIQYAESIKCEYEIDDKIFDNVSEFSLSENDVVDFYKRVKASFVPHDSQQRAFVHCVNNGRAIVLAPTSNGKSYVIYGLSRFEAMQGKRTLIIIDRQQLVEQLRTSFDKEYGGGMKVATIYDKIDPNECDVFITTWQSIYENPASWFKPFDCVIGDEVHKFKAESLKKIFSKCGHIATRYGFTATLDNDSKADRQTVIGMFGTPLRVSTTKEDMDKGISSRATIHCITLKYPSKAMKDIKALMNEKLEEKKKRRKGVDQSDLGTIYFSAEYTYLEGLEERNRFIAKLATSLNGNTIIAFRRTKHGKALYEMFKELGVENLHYVDGSTKLEKRLEIAEQIDNSNNAIAILSVGTSGTGLSIKNINNLIIACQIKSSIDVPQLIGRGLRKDAKTGKETVEIYDIGDFVNGNNDNPNVVYKHFLKRLEIYHKEQHNLQFYETTLKLK